MRNLKRVLSLALALVMMLGMMVIGANAASADFADGSEINYTEAVDVMSALKVLEGDGTNYNPSDILTRAEATTIICKMLMGPENAKKLVGGSVFTDVAANHWAAGYISYCASLDILAGNGDGTFNPEGQLTGVAFAKMLLVALGYDAEIEGYVNDKNWATNIAADAIEAGLNIEDVDLASPVTREQAAQMAFQTLTATMVGYSGGIQITNADGSKVTVGATRSEKATPSYTYADVATPGLQFCEKYFPTLKADLSGETDDFGYAARVWFQGNNKDDNVLTAAKVITTVTTAKVLATYTAGVENVSRGDLYKVTGNVGALNIYENGADTLATVTPAKGIPAKAFTAYKGAQVEVVDNDGDGNADSVLVTYGYLAKVTDVVAATATADRKVKLSVYSDTDHVAVANVLWETEDFAKNDYVLVYPNGTMTATEAWNTATFNTTGNILAVEAAEAVSGKIPSVTGVNGASVTAIVLDGTTYKAADAKLATLGIAASTGIVDSDFALGSTTYTLYLSNGYVVGAVGAAATKDLSEYVYVVAASGTGYDEFGVAVNLVQVVKMDGTTEVYTASGVVGSAGLYKAVFNNGTKKYTFTAATDTTATDINNTTDFFGQNQINDASLSMTEKTTSVTIDTVAGSGATKAYITDNTRIIFVSGTGKALKVNMVTGAIKQAIADDSLVLLSKQAPAMGGNYEVEVIIVSGSLVTASENLVYVNSSVVGETHIGNTDYNTYTIYNIEDDTKIVVPAVAASVGYGISSYEIDANGVYTFYDVANSGATNADGVYYAINGELSLYNNLLTLVDADGQDFTDLDASGAVIVNATGSAANNGLALKDLKAAASLNAEILVKDSAVVAIVVTSYTAP